MNYNLLLVLFLFCTSGCQEYLYPIAVVNREDEILVYVLYQKSLDHLELWQWNPKTLIAQKALLSTFSPAGLKLIPDSFGFSFIDNGRIKIKSFAKRSPKSLDIYEPIYNINLINWIDSTACYFSAQEHDQWNVYHLTTSEHIYRLLTIPKVDCTYPSKVDNTLFYIQKKEDGSRANYGIWQSEYPHILVDEKDTFNNTQDFDQRVAAYLDEQKKYAQGASIIAPNSATQVYDFGSRSIAFLTMVSDTQGYVLEHESKIEKQDKIITMYYHQIEKLAHAWQDKLLFSFNLPLHLLLQDTSNKLYESILPILPRLIGNTIYFSSCDAQNNLNLNLFSYNLVDQQIAQLTYANRSSLQHYFCPIQLDGTIIYGGSLCASPKGPAMIINEDQEICFEFPLIKDHTNEN